MAESASRHDPRRLEWEHDLGREALCLAVSGLFALPLAADAIAVWLGWHLFFLEDAKIQLVWATVVQFWGGHRLHAGALRALRTGSGRAEALGALLVMAVYAGGAYLTFVRPGVAGLALKASAAGVAAAALVRLIRVAGGPPGAD